MKKIIDWHRSLVEKAQELNVYTQTIGKVNDLGSLKINNSINQKQDFKDFGIGAQIILRLGFKKLRFMTNNPKKVASVSEMGLEVIQRVELLTHPTDENAPYLSTKASKSGHLL